METAGRCGAAKGLHRMNISLKGKKNLPFNSPSKAFVLQKAAGEASAEAKRSAPLPDRPPPSLSLPPSPSLFSASLAQRRHSENTSFSFSSFYFACVSVKPAIELPADRIPLFLLTVSDFYLFVFSPLPSTCAPLSLVEFKKGGARKVRNVQGSLLRAAVTQRFSSRLMHSASPFSHSARY